METVCIVQYLYKYLMISVVDDLRFLTSWELYHNASAPIRNQLIECAENVIANKLISEIDESGVFAIFE